MFDLFLKLYFRAAFTWARWPARTSIFSNPYCAWRAVAPCPGHRQADKACPRAAHKTGAYRNLRFFTLAALVPSAGILRTLKNLIGLVSGVSTCIPLGMGGTRLSAHAQTVACEVENVDRN
jgi:hypothetical protein